MASSSLGVIRIAQDKTDLYTNVMSMTTLAIRIPATTKRRLKRLSQSKQRAVSDLVRQAVDEYVLREAPTKGTAKNLLRALDKLKQKDPDIFKGETTNLSRDYKKILYGNHEQ